MILLVGLLLVSLAVNFLFLYLLYRQGKFSRQIIEDMGRVSDLAVGNSVRVDALYDLPQVEEMVDQHAAYLSGLPSGTVATLH